MSQQVGTGLELFEAIRLLERVSFVLLCIKYFKKSERRASFIYFTLFNLQTRSKNWVQIARAKFFGGIRHAEPVTGAEW